MKGNGKTGKDPREKEVSGNDKMFGIAGKAYQQPGYSRYSGSRLHQDGGYGKGMRYFHLGDSSDLSSRFLPLVEDAAWFLFISI